MKKNKQIGHVSCKNVELITKGLCTYICSQTYSNHVIFRRITKQKRHELTNIALISISFIDETAFFLVTHLSFSCMFIVKVGTKKVYNPYDQPYNNNKEVLYTHLPFAAHVKIIASCFFTNRLCSEPD